jgi:hypothetical protein
MSLSTFVWMTSIDTLGSDSTEASSSTITHIGALPTLTYFISTRIAVNLKFFTSTESTGSSISSGNELGARYYFLGEGASQEIKSDSISILTRPRLTYFAELNYKTRTFEAETTVLKFMGINAAIGADLFLNDQYFVTSTVSYDYMFSGAIRELSGLNLMAGIGSTF